MNTSMKPTLKPIAFAVAAALTFGVVGAAEANGVNRFLGITNTKTDRILPGQTQAPGVADARQLREMQRSQTFAPRGGAQFVPGTNRLVSAPR